MARKSIKPEEKKIKFSITISPENNGQLEELHINKSKLINWLLQEHFNKINTRVNWQPISNLKPTRNENL
jgi:hypothetical protein